MNNIFVLLLYSIIIRNRTKRHRKTKTEKPNAMPLEGTSLNI